MLTCNACQCYFETSEEQREHFRLDWHRYNLKRKTVGLAPIAHDAFEQRQEEHEAKHNKDSSAKRFKSAKCFNCKKSFTNMQVFEQHRQSKKHAIQVSKSTGRKENVQILYEEPTGSIEESRSSDLATDGEEIEEEVADMIVDEKECEEDSYEAAIQGIPLDAVDCIFCKHRAEDVDSCLSHMCKNHGFFLPDTEYLTDIPDMLRYLSEKVKIGRMCLYCSAGNGEKVFSTYQDVQKHMEAKSHCKIRFETERDVQEFEDFYDFSSSYARVDAENEDVKWETESEEEVMFDEDGNVLMDSNDEYDDVDDVMESNAMFITVTGELSLGDGRTLGTRQMRRYYKQKLRAPDARASVMANTKEKLLLMYHQAGLDTSTPMCSTLVKQYAAKFNTLEVRNLKESRAIRNKAEKHRGRLDFRSHKLQKNPNRKVMVTV